MGFAVTAEPDRFEEAEEWFASRVTYTREQLATLSEQARNRAWWISGVAQLDIIDQVHQSILRAIRDSEDFDEWKAKIEQQLTDAWGRRDSARLETIFVNATQHAYSAGRHKQMTDPVILQHRPIWEFDAIDDGRISAICKARNGTRRPADDPWWTVNHPLLHHRCRSRIRTLTRKQANDRGGLTERIPIDPPVSRGFGRTPELDDWDPDLSKVSPKLVTEFQKKTARKRPEPRIKESTHPLADRKRAAEAFKLADGGKAARKLLEEQIAHSVPGAVSRDLVDGKSGASVLEINDKLCRSYAANGLHTFSGEIHVTKKAMGGARKGLRLVGKAEVTAADIAPANGLRTVVHESLHASSRLSAAGYEGVGKVLEEASVELTARRIVHDIIPGLAKGSLYYEHRLGFGSYQNYIDELVAIVRLHGRPPNSLGLLSPEAAAERIAAASARVFGPGASYSSSGAMLDDWADGLGLDAAATERVKGAIRDITP